MFRRMRQLITAAALLVPMWAVSNAATIGHWRFEEGTPGNAVGTGTVPDSSGNGLDGTGVVGANSLDYTSAVPGPSILPGSLSNNVSLDFGGGSSGGRVELAHDAAFNAMDGGFTVEAFIYSEDASGSDNDRKGIVTKWLTATEAVFQFRESSDDTLLFILGIEGSGNVSLPSTSAVPDGEWAHVAAVYDPADSGAEMKIYINGVLSGSGAFGADFNGDGTDPLYIGEAGGGTGDQFAGLIDEVRISSGALAPSEFLSAVPEPTSLAMGLGVLGVAALAYRRRK